jgi:hypothetical protein
VKETKRSYDGSRKQRTKYVIQNGVKESREVFIDMVSHIEDAIENGVKNTSAAGRRSIYRIEDTIQNGVKYTDAGWAQYNGVEYAIKHGEKIELK